MQVCSIIARNYLPYARVLARSLLTHHPDALVSVLVVDAAPGELDGEPFEVLTAEDLDIEPVEYRRMALIYSVLELCTAVKPWLLEALLARGEPSVLYFDPDIEIRAPVDDLAELAEKHGIVLTPHTLSPMARDRRTPGETDILMSGVYNLGFLGVGESAAPFLAWWQERLARDCVSDISRGLFVDQRWVDFVPGYWDHHIVRDPGANVAYWNVAERGVERTPDGVYTAGGVPIRFFHYSGFEPGSRHLLSKYPLTTPRVLLSEHGAVADLCDAYGDALVREGFGEERPAYGYGTTASGIAIDFVMRSVARRALKDAESGGGAVPPPDPFEPDGAQAFEAWLNERDDDAPRFTRYLVGLHQARPDVSFAFPDLRGHDGDRYRDWLLDPNRPEPLIDEIFLAPLRVASGPPEPRDTYRRGVNVVGYVRAESGVGEGARLLVNALDHAGVETAVVAVRDHHNREEAPFDRAGEDAPFDVNIVCVNADQFPLFAGTAGQPLLDGRYTVGMWAWEVEEFPSPFWGAADFVDEIWMGSRHSAAAVGRRVSKPVLSFPLPVVVPRPPALDRTAMGLTDGFLFLFCFDYASVAERKNPWGLVEAFTRAFAPGEGPTLLIKTVNGDRHLTDRERLLHAVGDRPDIVVRDGYVSVGEQQALINACDAYVSLHRAEGFGLTMAEAMALGKPVIATAYSGNLEYMDERNSFLVPADLVAVGEGHDPYPARARWAAPDLDVAAEHMRRVVHDQRDAARRAQRGAEEIARDHGPTAAIPFLHARLDIARRVRPRPAPLPPDVDELLGGPDIGSATNRGAAARLFRKGVLRALQHYREHQQRVDRRILGRVDEVENALRRDIVGLLRGVEQRFDVLERRENALTRDVAALRDEIDAGPYLADPSVFHTVDDRGRRVLGYTGATAGTTADLYRDLEEQFRGSEDLIRARLQPYVSILAGCEPVLDLGCGRGELLDVLKDAGIAARGVDLDEGMAARAREKGHDVEVGDAIALLERTPDGALGAVVSFQLVEHLDRDALLRLMTEAHRTLRDGGVFIAETVNPHSSRALKAFWLDLTHVHPVYPEMALALCRSIGFPEARVVFPVGSGDLDSDRVTQGEYAVVARKGGS